MPTKRTVLDEMRDLDYTAADVGEEWLRTLEGQAYSPHTLRTYADCLSGFLSWFKQEFGREATMADLGTQDAGKRVGNRYKSALQRNGRSPGTINLHISALQGLTRYASQNSYLEEDTMRAVARAKLGKRQPAHLTDDQIAAIEATLDETNAADFRTLLMIRLLLDTGLRAAELCSITLDRLEVETAAGRPLLQGSVRVIGKGNKERTVGFGEWATKRLRRYLRHVRPLPADPASADYVFLSYAGRPLTAKGLTTLLARIGKRAGIKLHPHMLRHTFATNYVSPQPNGESGNVAELMDLLGHTDPTMSMRYVHLAGNRANLQKQQRLSHTDQRLREQSQAGLSQPRRIRTTGPTLNQARPTPITRLG